MTAPPTADTVHTDANQTQTGRDRRVAPRCPGRRWVSCRTPGRRRSGALPASVLDVSASGIGLCLGRPLGPRDVVSLEWQGTGRTGAHMMLARVVHAAPVDAVTWAVGCEFARRLTDEELASLL